MPLKEHSTGPDNSVDGPYETIASEMSPTELQSARHDAYVGFMPYVKERADLERLLAVVPKEHQLPYLERVAQVLSVKEMAAGKAGLYGLLNELETIHKVMSDGLEKVNFDVQGQIGHIAYLGYDRFADMDHQPNRLLQSTLDLDVPLDRDGEPYVYEVKTSFKEPFGTSANQRNQLLKYQAAVSSGAVAGASVRLKGLIDPSFIAWANRKGRDATIPDVELLYTIELPSHGSYIAKLKEGTEGQALKYINRDPVLRKDKVAIRSIEKAIKEGVLGDLIGIVSQELPEQKVTDSQQKKKLLKQRFFDDLLATLSDYSQRKPSITSRVGRSSR